MVCRLRFSELLEFRSMYGVQPRQQHGSKYWWEKFDWLRIVDPISYSVYAGWNKVWWSGLYKLFVFKVIERLFKHIIMQDSYFTLQIKNVHDLHESGQTKRIKKCQFIYIISPQWNICGNLVISRGIGQFVPMDSSLECVIVHRQLGVWVSVKDWFWYELSHIW